VPHDLADVVTSNPIFAILFLYAIAIAATLLIVWLGPIIRVLVRALVWAGLAIALVALAGGLFLLSREAFLTIALAIGINWVINDFFNELDRRLDRRQHCR
jgi:hypothetical protein